MIMPDSKRDAALTPSSENDTNYIKQSKSHIENHLEVENGTAYETETPDCSERKSNYSNSKIRNSLSIEPGDNSVDEYMAPPSAKNYGSRPPTYKNNSHETPSASSRKNFRDTWSSIAPTLKVLSPEEITEQEMNDLEIQDFGSASGSDLTDDSTDDEEVDEEEIAQYLNTLKLPGADGGAVSRDGSTLFQVIEPGKLDKESTICSSHAGWEQESLVNTARQIEMLENEADSEMDSDEENQIMKEIKNEITAKVREEMKGELAVMKRHIEAESGANKPVGDEDLQHLEPDLKAAFLKVRKLDRILAKKIKREHEVKRDRILLQRKLKKELEELKPEGREEVKEAQVNTSKFLALTLPPRHNAGIKITEDGEIEEDPSPPVTPLFTTQVPEEFESKSKRKSHSAKDGDEDEESRSSSRTSHTTASTSQASGTTSASRGTSKRGKKSKKKKDFIKRNMELAGDAANLIAMTEEEKARVGNLLADIDDIPESFVHEEPSASGGSDNPYQITLSASEGFHPAQDEVHRLEAIDRRLQALLPKSDYDSIASTPMPRGQSQQSLLFTRTQPPLGNYDIDALGERALRETKEERDMYERLKNIEFELNHITDRYEPEEVNPRLTQDTLDRLLDDCVRSMSTVQEVDTPEPGGHDETSRSASSVASRASLVSNPPRLEAHVLQELLAGARAEICGPPSRAALENGHNEGDMRVESTNSATPTNLHSTNESRAGSITPQAPPPGHQSSVNHTENNQSKGYDNERNSSPKRNGSATINTRNAINNANENTEKYPYMTNNTKTAIVNENHAQNDTVLNSSRPTTGDSRSSSRPSSSSSSIVSERKPFLPQIDHSGRMSTQRQGSLDNFPPLPTATGNRSSNHTPLLAKTVWGSMSEQDMADDSPRDTTAVVRSNNSTPVPHPPSSGRKSKNRGKHRTNSPTSK